LLWSKYSQISLNLAVINALPLPALDGGQMAFLLVEALTGSPVSSRLQEAVNKTALLGFLALSSLLLFGDLKSLMH
jgi:membrane-associated protease RseP (regulator of RpoE activity)